MDIVTWAHDESSFMQNAELVISHLGGLFVFERVNAEPVRQRRARIGGFKPELQDMIDRAEENPDAIIHGTFLTFLSEDA